MDKFIGVSIAMLIWTVLVFYVGIVLGKLSK